VTGQAASRDPGVDIPLELTSTGSPATQEREKGRQADPNLIRAVDRPYDPAGHQLNGYLGASLVNVGRPTGSVTVPQHTRDYARNASVNAPVGLAGTTGVIFLGAECNFFSPLSVLTCEGLLNLKWRLQAARR